MRVGGVRLRGRELAGHRVRGETSALAARVGHPGHVHAHHATTDRAAKDERESHWAWEKLSQEQAPEESAGCSSRAQGHPQRRDRRSEIIVVIDEHRVIQPAVVILAPLADLVQVLPRRLLDQDPVGLDLSGPLVVPLAEQLVATGREGFQGVRFCRVNVHSVAIVGLKAERSLNL